jgi:hypothetical protein
MRIRATLVAAMLLIALTWPGSAAGQAPTSWFGTWTYNAAKSTTAAGPVPFKRATCRIEPWEDGVKVTYDLVRVRGGITHLEWTGKFDGTDYPVQGVEVVVTNAYRRVDDRTYEVVQKVDGEVSVTARMAVSPDGKTLTTVTSVQNSRTTTTVFDRM